ncbi:hypothetical protein X760_20025 [Mesorhizobium sp. LSHC422A00]|nr:hypothetical protein X760_20025 [Mesorhizobium sp. LSHC422A00]
MVENGSRRLAECPGEDLGHMRDALGIEAEVVAPQWVVEQIGGVEAGIAEHALRVDRQPAARTVQNVVVMQVAMQRLDRMRGIEQPVRDFGGLDIEAVLSGVAIGSGLFEQAGKPCPQRLQVRRGRVSCGREQSPHQLGRDCGRGVVAFFGQNVGKQGVAGIFEQHAVAVPAKQPHRAFAAPPCEIVLAAQLVLDIVEWFERLDDGRRAVLTPHLPDAARKRLGNELGRADLPALWKCRRVHSERDAEKC